MATSLIEQARSWHAEIERLRQEIVDDLVETKVSSLKDEIAQGQRIHFGVKNIQVLASKLEKYYEDESGVRALEFDGLAGNGDDQQTFSLFYDQLYDLREFHKGAKPLQPEPVPLKSIPLEQMVEFSGEEFSGKYLDLYPMFQRFLNCKAFKRVKYVKYLRIFHDFDNVDVTKKNHDYIEYLQELSGYLVSYHERIFPLYPTKKIMDRIKDHYTTKSEVEPLFCDICSKQFSKATVFEHHVKSQKHVKKAKLRQNGNISFVDISLLEEQIRCYAILLSDRIQATIQFAESMQTQTFLEMYTERTRVSDPEESSDEEEGTDLIYNPKNVPLGWDGKPIPYWLYKLHGLNIEYKCEICGDFSYWGPRAFDQHFGESRHVNGLRTLGIPNSKHFKNITKMDDAIALYHRIQDLDKNRIFRPEVDEEFEDAEGNVFNRKTFEDLRRQGLL